MQALEPSFTEEWYTPEQLRRLGELAASTAGLDGLVLEIGCWEGRSTIALAQAVAPAALIACDHFRGSPETPSMQAAAAARDVLRRFLANLAVAGCRNVRLWPDDWRTFAAQRRGPALFRFVHLDGSHLEAEVRDQIAYCWPRLQAGGILAGDDWRSWPGVRQAVEAAALPGLQTEGNLWWAVKP